MSTSQALWLWCMAALLCACQAAPKSHKLIEAQEHEASPRFDIQGETTAQAKQHDQLGAGLDVEYGLTEVTRRRRRRSSSTVTRRRRRSSSSTSTTTTTMEISQKLDAAQADADELRGKEADAKTQLAQARSNAVIEDRFADGEAQASKVNGDRHLLFAQERFNETRFEDGTNCLTGFLTDAERDARLDSILGNSECKTFERAKALKKGKVFATSKIFQSVLLFLAKVASLLDISEKRTYPDGCCHAWTVDVEEGGKHEDMTSNQVKWRDGILDICCPDKSKIVKARNMETECAKTKPLGPSGRECTDESEEWMLADSTQDKCQPKGWEGQIERAECSSELGEDSLLLEDALDRTRTQGLFKKTFKKIGTAVKKTATSVGTAVKKTATSVGTAVKKTATSVGTAVKKTATTVATFATQGLAGGLIDMFLPKLLEKLPASLRNVASKAITKFVGGDQNGAIMELAALAPQFLQAPLRQALPQLMRGDLVGGLQHFAVLAPASLRSPIKVGIGKAVPKIMKGELQCGLYEVIDVLPMPEYGHGALNLLVETAFSGQLMQIVTGQKVEGDNGQDSIGFLAPKIKAMVVEPYFASKGFPYIAWECAMQRWIQPLVSAEYVTIIESHNILHAGKDGIFNAPRGAGTKKPEPSMCFNGKYDNEKRIWEPAGDSGKLEDWRFPPIKDEGWKEAADGVGTWVSNGPLELRVLLMDQTKCSFEVQSWGREEWKTKGNDARDECGDAQPICEYLYSADMQFCGTSRKCLSAKQANTPKPMPNPDFDCTQPGPSWNMPRFSDTKLLHGDECHHKNGCSGSQAYCQKWFMYHVGVMQMSTTFLLNTESALRIQPCIDEVWKETSKSTDDANYCVYD